MGYTAYCSDPCSKKYRSATRPYNQVLSNKDWLFEQRFTQKRSKESLAEELGCSTTVINKWLKIHDFPAVRYNESNTDILLKLRDYQWLYGQYVTENKTCEEIADMLGSTKSTISIYLHKHNIEISAPNSYDRTHNKVSSEELEVLEFVATIYAGNIITNSRTICSGGLEIDIYIPEKNLAIEYNGVYSHLYRPDESSFSGRKDSAYHLKKTMDCHARGIKLIHIFSSSWYERKDNWKNFIRNQLNLNTNKIPARKCVIGEISVDEKNLFLDQHHLQGKDKSSLKYGLFYDGVLVSVMTFAKPRFSSKCDWELTRFAVKGDYTIIGGFSKLLSHMRKTHDGTIVSYADRMYSNGDVYSRNGFVLDAVNRPSYYYVCKNSTVLINRMNLTKKNLLKKLYKPHLTENELARELGYSKIYDCGTLTYILT